MNTNSGKRYAQASFELALGSQALDTWQIGLEKVADMARDKKLMDLLENPGLSFAAKKTLLQEQLGDVIPLVLNLSCLLVSRGRLSLANSISQEYARLLDAHRGIKHAEVVTALPLGDKDKEMISHRLGDMVGHKKVVIDARVDPSIIGGVRAKIGDMLVDDSIRYRLASLRRSLEGE
ncbi:MAG: ATP synthase F1 subunit delta [Dehalococcoidia bacterium]|nr:ATP synthase F1 subunit delta [Dehalococcoidia bacterium]